MTKKESLKNHEDVEGSTLPLGTTQTESLLSCWGCEELSLFLEAQGHGNMDTLDLS